jgi:hypothetical protein
MRTKMTPPSKSVLKSSAEIAELLRADPVATGLVKEHLPVGEILRLFDISESDMCAVMNIPVPADPCEDGN